MTSKPRFAKKPQRTISNAEASKRKTGFVPVMRKYKRYAAHVRMARKGIPHVNRETFGNGEKRPSLFARDWRAWA